MSASLIEAALAIARQRDDEPHGYVYVLRSDVRGLSKIGYTEHLEKRIAAQRYYANGLGRRAPELRAVLVCEFETRDQAAAFESRLLWLAELCFECSLLPVDWFPLDAEAEDTIVAMAMRRRGFVAAFGWLR